MSNVSQTMVVPKRFDSEKFGENKYEKTISLTDYWLGKFLAKIDFFALSISVPKLSISS